MAGEVFYRNGIEWPLTLELLAIFLLPTPAVLFGSGDAAAPRAREELENKMSAIGTKRTYRVALHMSAFGGKADIGYCTANVCL